MIHHNAKLGLGLAAALLVGGVAHAQDTVVVPPPQQAVTTDDTTSTVNPLLVSGLVTFGISYGSAVIVAATSDHQGDDRLYIPIAGPWLDLADRGDCPVGSARCDNETTNKVLLVIDGVFQGAGAIAFLGGVLSPTETRRTHTTTVSDRGVHFAPASLGRATPGLVAFGTF